MRICTYLKSRGHPVLKEDAAFITQNRSQVLNKGSELNFWTALSEQTDIPPCSKLACLESYLSEALLRYVLPVSPCPGNKYKAAARPLSAWVIK